MPSTYPRPHRLGQRAAMPNCPLALAAYVLPALLAPWMAQAAPPSAQQLYRQERAACLDGSSSQAREPCLREAAAALAEARRGGLGDAALPAQLAANALRRCAVVRAEDRDACERLARGEGQTSGSVGAGGLFKQIVTPIPADAAASTSKP